MATRATFHPGPVLFSGPQPPSASSSPVGQSPLRTLALPPRPTAGRWWTGSAGGTLVGILPGARWKSSGLSSIAAACLLGGSPDGTSGGGGGRKKGESPGGGGARSSNYAVPLGRSASGITRPLGEILRDLNKRVPPNLVDPEDRSIPWYHANRLLSFHAPGWCGEAREVIFSQNGSVTVVYRVTIRGSDGEAYRESTGTVSTTYRQGGDPVAAAEEIAFCRACARFGLGLYLYHDDKNM